MESVNVNNEMTANQTVINELKSINSLNEIQMKVTTVEALQAEGKEIVFLAFNRDVTDKTPHVKALAKSIKEEGLHTPLYLVPATIALNEGIELLDSRGSKVTDGTNKLAVTDGNNKFKAVQVLRSSKDAGRANEPIKCLIDENATDIQRMVMTINNVVKTWGHTDALKAASKIKPSELIDFLIELSAEKYSPSTQSLLVAFNTDTIKKNFIMEYNAGKVEFPKCCNINRAKKILAAAKEVGFSNQFIKSRYLIKAIIEQFNIVESIDKVLEALKTFTKEEIQFAEENRDLSLLADRVTENENK